MDRRYRPALVAIIAFVGVACSRAANPTPSPVSTASVAPTLAATAAPTLAVTAAPTPTVALTPTAPTVATPTPRSSPPGPLRVGREIHTATLLTDGGVLVAGGFDWADHPLASASRFDPNSGTFSATGSMTDGRNFDAASVVIDGRVLVTGGMGAHGPFASAEIYDPLTGAFSPID